MMRYLFVYTVCSARHQAAHLASPNDVNNKCSKISNSETEDLKRLDNKMGPDQTIPEESEKQSDQGLPCLHLNKDLIKRMTKIGTSWEFKILEHFFIIFAFTIFDLISCSQSCIVGSFENSVYPIQSK